MYKKEHLMDVPKQFDLANLLHYRPIPIWDPVPWLLPVLKREEILEVAQIHGNYQKAVNEAHTVAVEQLQAVLKRGIGR
jgi:hypothetical protein